MRFTPRIVFAAIFAVCAGLLAFGYYLQEYKGLDPCPMCILQRYAFFAIAFVALAAAVHGPRQIAVKGYGALLALLAVAGGGWAVRHSRLHPFPPPPPSSPPH